MKSISSDNENCIDIDLSDWERPLQNLEALSIDFSLAYCREFSEKLDLLVPKIKRREISKNSIERVAFILHRLSTFLQKRISIFSKGNPSLYENYKCHLDKWESERKYCESILHQSLLRTESALLEAPYVNDIVWIITQAHKENILLTRPYFLEKQSLGTSERNLSSALHSLENMGLILVDSNQNSQNKAHILPGNWLHQDHIKPPSDQARITLDRLLKSTQ